MKYTISNLVPSGGNVSEIEMEIFERCAGALCKSCQEHWPIRKIEGDRVYWWHDFGNLSRECDAAKIREIQHEALAAPAEPADTASARLEELEWCRQYVKEGTDEFSPSKIIDKRIAELKDMQVTDIPIVVGRPLTLEEWLKERMLNARRIAETKIVADRDAWLEDARNFEQALSSISAKKLDIPAAQPDVTFAERVAAYRRKFGGPWDDDSEVPDFLLLNEIRNDGFEAAHALQRCGHSRGDYRDPNYIPGKPETYEAKEVCIGCERETKLAAQPAGELREALQKLRDEADKSFHSWADMTDVHGQYFGSVEKANWRSYYNGKREAFDEVLAALGREGE